KAPVPFATWEMPEYAARFCLTYAGLNVEDIDAVAYSYDPTLATSNDALTANDWEMLRTIYVERAGLFLRSILPGFDPARLRHVSHHVAHAASAYLASPFSSCAVLVADGRGERTSYLAGHAHDGQFDVLAR